jgi:uncharacterized protein YyaL (SSP411 family)
VTNRLATQDSAYLRLHAEQPVDWYPWGPEALAQAKALDKPILLSIGYGACHWCHVMARESFDDPATAALMNEGFINIKVDRQERPDIDQLYQQAHQVLRRSGGGWPLTIFLSPQGVPFYSGTYFPAEAQPELPAFGDTLHSVSTVWQDKRTALQQQDLALLAHFDKVAPHPSDTALDAAVARQARDQLASAFDATNGGFGVAPKFPHPTDLAFLLAHSQAQADEEAKGMALFTLRQMAQGGLYDQIGGGFFRYSTDAQWQIPHFEKMLCDNALLLSLYTQALAVSDEPLFRQVISDTVGWVLREMLLSSGGFMASQPADDSQGQEGGYYVWERDPMREALKPNEWDVCAAHWGLIDEPNVAGRYWHLNVVRTAADWGRMVDYPVEVMETLIKAARIKLLAVRDQRQQPPRDEQVLTSWHALMITALTQAATACQRPEWLQAARAAMNFIRTERWSETGGLLSSPGQSGFLDDHAFVLEAALALHAADPQPNDLPWAQRVAQALIFRFEDTAEGAFFFTPHDAAPLFHRLKPSQDTATPSGNGTAAQALLKLARLCPDGPYREAALRCISAMAQTAAQDPTSHTRLIQAAAMAG